MTLILIYDINIDIEVDIDIDIDIDIDFDIHIDSPVSPGRPSSGVVGECELPHPVHGGDGVVPPVPPPPGQDASHPGGLQAVQHLNIHLQTTHCRHCRQMY